MEKNVCLAVIYKKRLLVIKSRRTWVLPRKKRRLGELKIDCVFRLIKEGLGLRVKDLMPLGKFNGKNLLLWFPVKAKVYVAKAEKEFFDNTFDQENGIKWIKNLESYKISKRTRRIFWILKSEGYL